MRHPSTLEQAREIEQAELTAKAEQHARWVALGKRMKIRRQLHAGAGVTCRGLQEALGISSSVLYYMETGKLCYSSKMVERAEAFFTEHRRRES